MKKNLTNCNNIKLTPGSKIKIGKTEYTIFGTFTDDGEEFLMAKYLSSGKYTGSFASICSMCNYR